MVLQGLTLGTFLNDHPVCTKILIEHFEVNNLVIIEWTESN